jgi:RHS repeat-associated protein
VGRVTGIAYPGGLGVGYAYSAGRLTAMTATLDGVTRTVANNFTYRPFGPVDGWTYGNGLERRYDFDINGRLFGISSGTANTLWQSLTYGFNAGDELTAITNGVEAWWSRKFQYDLNGRLAQETLRGSAWTYDPNGNRRSWIEVGIEDSIEESAVIDPGSNRLLRYSTVEGTRSYGYDALGNRITETAPGVSKSYTYDGFNRLRSATVDGVMSLYTVNALDQRIGKTTGAGSTRFVYAGQNQLLAERDTNGWTNYLWLGGELIGLMKPDKQLFFVHNDHLGRPEFVTDGMPMAVWFAENAEYDRIIHGGDFMHGFGRLNIGFPGQYFDAETGLWQNGHREYDAEIGGYTQPDPIGLAGGSYSTYAYVGGNPISYVDPSGLGPISFGACTVANAAKQGYDWWKASQTPPEIQRLTDEINKVGNELKDCPVDDNGRYFELQAKLNDLGQQLLTATGKHAAANVSTSWQQAQDALLWESVCLIALVPVLP